MSNIVCFGEMLLRLAPAGATPIAIAPGFEAHIGGAEANVAAALAQLGHDVSLLSILPDSPLGDLALRGLARFGVDVTRVQRRAGRMGLYFLDPATGPRPARITYDRAGSAFVAAAGGQWDDSLFASAGWLHLSGITAALGPGCLETSLAVMRAAKRTGAQIAFDCNYRANLWESWGGDAAAAFQAMIAEADILFGNHRDVAMISGRAFTGEGHERAAAEAAFARFPKLRLIAGTSRLLDAPDAHHLSARIDLRERGYERPAMRVAGIVDRIGAGDAFAAGVLHGLIEGETPERALDLGLAALIQKHFIKGDMWIGNRSDLIAEAGDVRR